jgi:hypothetical protein
VITASATTHKENVAIRSNESHASSATGNISVLANIFLSHLLRDAESGVA